MKQRPWSALPAAVLLLTIVIPSRSAAAPSTIPAAPAGVLSAYPTVVQTGTYPTLTWRILYPSKVSDVAFIRPPGTLSLTQSNLYVSVQEIGTGVTDGSSTTAADVPAEARISINGNSYAQLFYGKQKDVEPAYSLYIKKHDANTTIDFGGRYVKNEAWTDFYTTRSSNFQSVALMNGDTIPSSTPVTQANAASFLKPYLDSTGKVNIGPMSVLILMELGHTDRNKPGFDMQDQALLVTLSTKHPNNGHGNNLDGVDSSNPGRGKGGPNGQVDPSGGVDDERK